MDTARLVGQTIDQYQIISHIARGGMADVYLAKDVDLERNVAFKVMLDVLALDPQYVRRFRREAKTVARLDHPHIVQIFSTGQTHLGQPYIAMQFIDGGSLRDKLRQLRERGKLLTADQALNIIRQLALALSVAHNAKVVHRDLKPGNVLIRLDGTPVLVDLGIAAVMSGPKLTNTGGLVGTPQYMAPEQVASQPLDGRSDLYALGIILYEMLTGSRPFDADETMAVLYKQVHEQPRPLEQLRPDLAAQTHIIVETCLQKDPAHRYQKAEDMITAIDKALRAEGSHGPNPGATQVLTTLTDSELISRGHIVQAVPSQPEIVAPAATPPSVSAGTGDAGKRRIPLWVLVTFPIVVILAVAFAILSSRDTTTPEATIAVISPTDVPLAATGAATDTPTILIVTVTDVPTAVPVPVTSSPGPAVVTDTPPPVTVTSRPTDTPAATATPRQPTNTPTPTVTPQPQGLDEMIIGSDGLEMRLVPEGEFARGSSSADINDAIDSCRGNADGDSCAFSEFSSEQPQRDIYISAFYMDVTEITNNDYRSCVNDGGCSPPDSGSGTYSRSSYYENVSFGDYPVVYVSWSDARDYCAWAGERLPTEAEWEKAARGVDGRVFPWGNNWNSNRANTQDSGSERIKPVGQYSNGTSPYGMLDMAGNVWEYVTDWYEADYYNSAPARNPQGPNSSSDRKRVLRGGSYANFRYYARVTNRGAVPPDSSTSFRGFRCVIEAASVTP